MPSGLGDVQVYPTYDGVIIELRCDPHRVALLTNTPELAAFLDRTLAMVPTDAAAASICRAPSRTNSSSNAPDA